eukprot:TRINITY_DN43223_c0_g1_i1.p2 TRINITY_DN43223_c0_g1~~TRINITY_DN43223_c0_g1_i1.p2  ORF type:complete len:107 (+),score=6.94 TRINITY_DN43223_c0_g1_i1:33-353(+)
MGQEFSLGLFRSLFFFFFFLKFVSSINNIKKKLPPPEQKYSFTAKIFYITNNKMKTRIKQINLCIQKKEISIYFSKTITNLILKKPNNDLYIKKKEKKREQPQYKK